MLMLATFQHGQVRQRHGQVRQQHGQGHRETDLFSKINLGYCWLQLRIQMYANAYQNAPCFEVWDSKVDPAKNQLYKQLFKISPNANPRAFDKQAKSYLTTIQGQNGKMTLPADDSKTLALHQRFLVLHAFVPIGFQWWLELVLSDLSGIKRRVYLTTVQGKQQAKYFSYRYPVQVTKGAWLFLGIDVFSFMGVFKDQTFRALEQISVGSHCRLRRIFTMKEFVEFQIPNSYWLSQQIGQSLQLIQFREQPKLVLPSKMLTESVPSPKREEIKKSLSNSRRQDINRSDLSEISPKERAEKVIDKKMVKSEIIIQNARARLQSLQREEELIFSQNRENQRRPFFQNNSQSKQPNKKSEAKKLQSIKQQLQKLKKSDPGPPLAKQDHARKLKGKLPLIQKPFKQDEALDAAYQQSSAATEQNDKIKPRSFLESKEVNESDLWQLPQRQTPHGQQVAYGKIKVTKGEHAFGNGLFPSTIITKENNAQITLKKSRMELELIYDQMVGCYYHPETNTYYEIT